MNSPNAHVVTPSPNPVEHLNPSETDTHMKMTSLNEDNLSIEQIPNTGKQTETVVQDFPPLPSAHSFAPVGHNADTQKSTLIAKARGLMNLVGLCLEEMESSCPSAGVDFWPLGKDIRKTTPNSFEQFSSQNKGSTWATRAASGKGHTSDNIPRGPPSTPSPPQSYSKEDRRIMIRQQLQRLIPDPSFVVDAWQLT
ncbi:hypothetical protein GcC1_004007 [Golovinomyces cichoracearum]|uniref:Uncharacterized protein n=1 Tax=Golovinomyces cichoracearum TaxID=62708 RepID=A0A420J907_9PEZI|nr:hypothetical protein GcC1_004007 [Golovinomyces cichoracearum]